MKPNEILSTDQTLTVEIAQTLIGKRIKTAYSGYLGQDGDDEFIVGEVISELEYYRQKKEECFQKSDSKFKNRAEYWESYMTEKQLKERSEKLLIITADGRNTYIYADPFNKGMFTCSDSDRFVSFTEIPTYVRVNGCGSFDGWRLKIIRLVERVTQPAYGPAYNIFECENPDGTIATWSDNVFSYEN